MSNDAFATHFDGQDPFAPERIDEQITARLAGKAPADRETQIAQGLATLNTLPPGADDSLARVRMRLRTAPFPIQTSSPTIEVNRSMDFQTQPSRWPSSSPTRTPPRGPSPARRTIQTLVAVTAVILLIGGFYALTQRHSPGPGGQPTATTTNTATNTAQATATSATTLPAASAEQLAACGFPASEPAYDLGNGLIVRIDTSQTYPAFQLPEGTPLKPFTVSANPSSQFPDSPLVNPDLRNGGLSLVTCNIGQQPITIQGVRVSIASFTAYSGQLNGWYPCDGMYSGPNTAGSGGCGGGGENSEIVQATFTANSGAGTVVDAVQKAAPPTAPGSYGPLPFELPVRRANSDATGVALIKVEVIPPTTAGTYTLGLGLVTKQGQTALAPVQGQMLLAPFTHKWDGQACEAPNMASQIPAETNPPTYYICPQS